METQTKTQQPPAPAKCTNADRGIRKRISEPLYPADILSDRELNTCSLKAYGAYCKFLVQIIHDNTDHITDDLPGWARFWACRPPEAPAIIAELKKRGKPIC